VNFTLSKDQGEVIIKPAGISFSTRALPGRG